MKLYFVLLIVLLFLIAACTPEEKQCTVNEDCIPSQCCHATETVNKKNAPDCRNVLCTLQCEPGTLDCGQGEVKCVDNICTAVIKEK
ncbi:hypothetical protein J4421_00480 [Candidatus Woesearchaeota archaeon]|nr:hypothetical protein [Candidatus Woesearchaeota archaeon]